MMSQQDAIQEALMIAGIKMRSAFVYLEEYLQAGELSSEERLRIRKWLVRLEQMFHEAELYRIGVEEYPAHQQETLLKNTKQLIHTLEQVNHFSTFHHVNPEELLGWLSSICPLWPFC
jgi:hypothetical protein